MPPILSKAQTSLVDALTDVVVAETVLNPDLSLCDIYAALTYLSDKASAEVCVAMEEESDAAETWKKGGAE